jgi:dihydrofolate reductase
MPQEPRPRISLVVAVADNGVIGNAGDLPWRMSGDLQRFKQLTMGHVMVMGRKTYESIGRPLPGRVTVVLTTNHDYDPGHTEVRVAHSLDDATAQALQLGMNNDELFVVGGAEIYRLALPRASRVYRTRVHASPEGDVHFPELPSADWQVVESQEYPADAKNEFACTWEVLERHEKG